jgi:hypothetical protein
MDEKMKKMSKAYVYSAFVAVLLATLISYVVVAYLSLGVLMAVVASFCICRVVLSITEAVTLQYVKTKIYGGDEELFKSHIAAISSGAFNDPLPAVEENKQVTNVNATFNIVAKPDKPIARFMDADIYEWFDLESSNGAERFVYYGTIDVANNPQYTVPDGCILINPGIIYRHHSLEQQDAKKY